jgi:hypothetical protein
MAVIHVHCYWVLSRTKCITNHIKVMYDITIEIRQVQISYFFKHRLSIVQMLNGIRWVKNSDFWMFFMIVLQKMEEIKLTKERHRKQQSHRNQQ